MKKQLQPKKLRLNTETLRRLTSTELERVAGGATTLTCSPGGNPASTACTTEPIYGWLKTLNSCACHWP